LLVLFPFFSLRGGGGVSVFGVISIIFLLFILLFLPSFLKKAEETLGEGAFSPTETLCVGLARLGQTDQVIIAGTLEELKEQEFGNPLHSLIICGDTHELELEMLKQFIVEGSKYKLDEKET